MDCWQESRFAFLEYTCVPSHWPLAICLFECMQPPQTWDWLANHFHQEPKPRGAPTPTSAHSLKPPNDPSITQTLTPVPPPLQPWLWSAASDAVGQVLRPGNRATGFPLSPPHLTLACTGVPAPPGQPGPRSVPTRLQPLTAPTQKSASC